MIIPDINLLVYAYNADARHHKRAKKWVEALLAGNEIVGFPWPVLHGYLRIMTHSKIVENPFPPGEVLGHINSWLDQPITSILEPGRRHLSILENLCGAIGIAGNLTTDAVLAALAIEYQAELHSNDADFGRFSGLRWVNPLSDKP